MSSFLITLCKQSSCNGITSDVAYDANPSRLEEIKKWKELNRALFSTWQYLWIEGKNLTSSFVESPNPLYVHAFQKKPTSSTFIETSWTNELRTRNNHIEKSCDIILEMVALIIDKKVLKSGVWETIWTFFNRIRLSQPCVEKVKIEPIFYNQRRRQTTTSAKSKKIKDLVWSIAFFS